MQINWRQQLKIVDNFTYSYCMVDHKTDEKGNGGPLSSTPLRAVPSCVLASLVFHQQININFSLSHWVLCFFVCLYSAVVIVERKLFSFN